MISQSRELENNRPHDRNNFRAPSFRLLSGERVGCLALFLFAIVSPAFLLAQFQQPTDEELKMTVDPKAPGAAAVYLYREEITNEIDHFHSVYERIKVLAEKGKELATVTIPYIPGADKITKIEGRTIHADGTIVPLTVKPDDLMTFKIADFQENSIVFTLPSVEVGSILEYRYRYSYNYLIYMPAPTWWIQQPYFVHREHYSFQSNFPGLHEVQIAPEAHVVRDANGSAVILDKHDAFTLDITDVPPQPNEDWMPPLNTLKWRVAFFRPFVSSKEFLRNGKEFWDHAEKNWADEVRDFTNPTSGIKKITAEIVAPSDTDEQKARKIYAAVQKLDNTAFSRIKSKAERKKEKLKDIHKAEDVWKQQSGTDDEIALLYVALARAAGLKVAPMQVVNRNRAIFDNDYLSIEQLDDYLAVVVLDGKDVYLDPGQKMCPFGTLHWKHNLASGFRLSEKTAVIDMTPSSTFKESSHLLTADLYLDQAGNVNGVARIVMSGPEALHWRQLALENDVEEVKKQFIESMRDSLPDGVNADFDHFIALDDYNVNLMAIVNVSGNLGSVTSKHFILPGLFFESRAKHPFVAQDKRLTPIDLHYAMMERDDVTYHLPPGYAIESALPPSNVVWPDHAMLRINSTITDGSVKVARVFARNFTLLDPKEYNDLHDFYQKVATADQVQLVLTKTPPTAKGNQP
jgi:hypothetical protein